MTSLRPSLPSPRAFLLSSWRSWYGCSRLYVTSSPLATWTMTDFHFVFGIFKLNDASAAHHSQIFSLKPLKITLKLLNLLKPQTPHHWQKREGNKNSSNITEIKLANFNLQQQKSSWDMRKTLLNGKLTAFSNSIIGKNWRTEIVLHSTHLPCTYMCVGKATFCINRVNVRYFRVNNGWWLVWRGCWCMKNEQDLQVIIARNENANWGNKSSAAGW